MKLIISKIIVILGLFIIYLSTGAIASIITLNCKYEKEVGDCCRNEKIIIDEKSKKSGVEGTKLWDYRYSGPNTIIYEIFSYQTNDQPNRIIRHTIDLDKMEEEMIHLQIPEVDAEKVKIVAAKHRKNEVNYDELAEIKKKMFDKWYKKPEEFIGTVQKNWRDGMHPDEYVLFEPGKAKAYQISFIHRCEFTN